MVKEYFKHEDLVLSISFDEEEEGWETILDDNDTEIYGSGIVPVYEAWGIYHALKRVIPLLYTKENKTLDNVQPTVQ